MIPLAHLPWAAGGEFVNGLIHPLVNGSHVLVIAAGALWAGQQSDRSARCLLGGILLGSGAGLMVPPLGSMAGWMIAGGMALAGGAAAARWRLPAKMMIPCGAWLAFAVVQDTRGEGGAGLMAGVGISLTALALFVSAFARHLSVGKPWQAVGVRVMASWLLAIAMLMLALKW